MSDSDCRQGRRRYLAVLASVVGFSGCLGLEQSQSTPTGPRSDTRTGTDRMTAERETDTETSTPDDSEPDEEPEESLPSGTRWTFGAEGPFIAGPIHVDGTVIATSVDRNVYGVDAASGDQQWAVATETAVEKGLDVVDGTAVAAGNEEQLGVDIGDGTTTYQQVGFAHGVRQQTAGDEMVYQCRFNNGGIRAIIPATGEVAWSDRTAVQSDGEEHGSVKSIANEGETVCVGAQPESQFGSPPWAFAGYDAETGEQLWYIERDLDLDGVNPEVAVSDGICFAAIDNHYMAIDARSGTVQTEIEQSNTSRRVYGAVDGIVLLLRNGQLHGADIGTGETRWQFDVDFYAPPSSLDGSTFWFTDGGKLYEADVQSGSVRERQSLNVGDTSLTNGVVSDTDGLAVTDETVFVTTEDATLRALERQ